MNTRQILAATVLAAASCGAAAAPVFFAVQASSFAPGAGYGDDGNGNGGANNLLGVTFATMAGTHTATLSAGQSFSFTFGTITLNESQIDAGEADDLGVSAQFLFTDPLAGLSAITATGTAVAGPVNGGGGSENSLVDLTIDWDPVIVNFGTGGSFEISLADLEFTTTGALTQTATIALRSEPTVVTATAAVPEPGSAALAGLALLGLAAARRRP